MIVSNTSTLILLAKVNTLRLFLDMVKKLSIPKAVFDELFEKDDSFEMKIIIKEIKTKRIIFKKVKKRDYAVYIKEFKLHEGEAAAFSLIKTHNAKLILTDDRELIKLCKIENVPFVCALAIIVRLFEKNLLSKDVTLEKLQELNGYGRYSKEIYEYFKSKVI